MSGTLAVLGGGSWGTALSILLEPKFRHVRLWVRREELACAIRARRQNPEYLPGFDIPAGVEVTSSAETALLSATHVVCALPSHAVRDFFSAWPPEPGAFIVSATKGLEEDTLLRVSQVIEQATGSKGVAALSGPSFAGEAAAGHPTAVVIASNDPEAARSLQMLFSHRAFRVYSTTDLAGVELGGAYKNVIAIGAGVCHGLGFGGNAIAALITRGLAEMTRLAVAMGSQARTLAGLAGLGDLVLTCTGQQSRNRSVGEKLAQGRSVQEILSSTRSVAEGIRTTRSIVELGKLYKEELPIAQQMDAMLNSGRKPLQAIQMLMERSLKEEF